MTVPRVRRQPDDFCVQLTRWECEAATHKCPTAYKVTTPVQVRYLRRPQMEAKHRPEPRSRPAALRLSTSDDRDNREPAQTALHEAAVARSGLAGLGSNKTRPEVLLLCK